MQHDDPKLTAYALGELDDAADRAAVEAFLATDDSARRLVDEIRQTAATLTRGLHSAEIPTLTPEQRQTIAAARSEPAPLNYQSDTRRPRRLWVRWALATAACAALATVGVSLFTVRSPRAARMQVASNLDQIGQPQALSQNESKGDYPGGRLRASAPGQAQGQQAQGRGTGVGAGGVAARNVTPFGVKLEAADSYYETTEETVRVKQAHPDAKPAPTAWYKGLAGQVDGQGKPAQNPTPVTVNGGFIVTGAGAAPADNFRVLTPYGQTTPGQQAGTSTRAGAVAHANDPQWSGDSVLTLDARRAPPPPPPPPRGGQGGKPQAQ